MTKLKLSGFAIAVINQKGGVGKTTTAQILARELAKDNKVLLIDFDGQATLTELIDLYEHYEKEDLDSYLESNSILKIFNRESISPLDITHTANAKSKRNVQINELHFIPSPGNILSFTAEAVSGGKDLLLKKYINSIKHEYDYIVIDSLPSVSTLFKNVLLAADSLIIPIQTKTNAIAGANEFIKVVDEVMGDYDLEYKNLFILPTVYNSQRRNDNDVLAEIKTSYLDFIASREFVGQTKTLVLEPIPERAVYSNAQDVRMNVQDYIESFDRGKRDVLLLLEKITKNIKKNR
ncbi:ParA family protein [Sulfurimonas sp.]|uniref:ParA family protein n=1 Tax=Sulfurimonas sp. TaxID=2022749 RepID=UPI0025F8E724|nr:ParA family protein [Sulfurimonas sp.]